MKNTEAILKVPGTMEILPVEMPMPKSDEVLIKVEYVGLCGSDIHGFESGPFIPPKDPNQKIGLGHECSGTIVEIGNCVTNFKVGDRVTIEPGIPCGKCKYCMEGRYNICPSVDFMATQPNYRGSLTNYLCHPERFTYLLPDNMDLIEGSLVEPAAVGMHAAMLSGIKPGESAVILGAGCIGLMTLQALKIVGITDIIVVDIIEKRLKLAKQLGAKVTINAKTEDTVRRVKERVGDLGADVVFEIAGSAITAKQATQIVSRGGKIMIAGSISGETPIEFLKINREVTIQTVFRYANRFPVTIDAIATGKFDVKSMVTHEYDYQDIQRAFEDSLSLKEEIIKTVVKIESEG